MPVATVSQSVCPRCEEPVQGDYKFCPACAFRLRPGAPPVDEGPVPGRPWGLLLAVGGILLVVGSYFVGRQDSLEPPEVLPDPGEQHLRVADIQDHLMPIDPGIATYQGETVYELPGGDEAIQSLWQDFADEGGTSFLQGVLERPFVLGRWTRLAAAFHERTDALLVEKQRHVPVENRRFLMMAYEVTRGQYAEFLRSIDADPTFVTARWQGFVDLLWRPTEEPAYAHYYWDRWWLQVADHARETSGRELARPAWLERSNTRLSDSQGVLLLVPPAWMAVDAAGGLSWSVEPGTEDLPVTGVSWWDATLFAAWVRTIQGIPNLDLPTEADWLRVFHGNHAAKPDDDFEPKKDGWRWPWGDEIDPNGCNNLNFSLNAPKPHLRSVRRRYYWHEGKTVEGVLNMAGNAAEWVANWIPRRAGDRTDGPYYPQRSEENEETGKVLDEALILGGSYLSGIEDCSSRARTKLHKCDRAPHVGFRLMIEPAGPLG